MATRRLISWSTAMRDLRAERAPITDLSTSLRKLRNVSRAIRGPISGETVRGHYAPEVIAQLVASGQVRWVAGDRLEVLPVGVEFFGASSSLAA